ncbi:hypothetical protein N7G274_005098 [Stereocaulon virgatum]|uniref:Uncharacterized protein n=1 Tax=Stereocaulon virgatum TaxID=373712 RepID=A0ABR4AAK5_9LECA
MTGTRTLTSIPGWPSSWYDSKGNIPCPARGCCKVFTSPQSMSWRVTHWESEANLHETNTDHHILLLQNCLETCPYCGWASSTREKVKDLFDHELSHHGTQNTTHIDGFVTLVRQRRLGALGDRAAEPVFQRLMQQLAMSPCFGNILDFCPLTYDERFQMSPEIQIVMRGSVRPYGAPVNYPVRPENFLLLLEPDPDNPVHKELRWQETWDYLRAEYASGRI